MEDLVFNIIQALKDFFNPQTVIFIISLIPILELRGGLIAASILGIDWRLAMIICIIGNLIPVPFIIMFVKKIFEYLKNTKLSVITTKLEKKANKSSEKVFKYEKWGLYFFVAIPFPGTGAWTGSLVAALCGMKFKNAILSIFLGIITAAVIMALFSYGVIRPLIS